jgi:hypothetical protein
MAKKRAKAAGSNGKARFRQAALASIAFRPRTKQGKEREDAVERRHSKEKCPVKIPAEDVEKKAEALAKVIQDREGVLDEKRAINADFREKLNYFDERLKELAESVRSHSEVRVVECVEFLLERTHEVVLIRQDTGEQVGQARPAVASDVQDELPLGDEDDDEPDDDVKTSAELGADQDDAGDARAGDGG